MIPHLLRAAASATEILAELGADVAYIHLEVALSSGPELEVHVLPRATGWSGLLAKLGIIESRSVLAEDGHALMAYARFGDVTLCTELELHAAGAA